MKSGGVPGFTIGLARPSCCECINVSSKSNTSILRSIRAKFLKSKFYLSKS